MTGEAERKMAKSSPNWLLGMALGIGPGVALGVSLDNPAIGISLGVSMGVAFALLFSKRTTSPDGEDANDEKPPISSSETPADGSGKTSGGDE